MAEGRRRMRWRGRVGEGKLRRRGIVDEGMGVEGVIPYIGVAVVSGAEHQELLTILGHVNPNTTLSNESKPEKCC